MTTGLLITTAGRNAIIADLGGGADLVLTHVAWGDANGVPYNPNEAQVALVNEKYRATIASVAVVGGAIVVDAVIPADTNDGTGRPSHGFSVAEVGLFNNAGTLIGLARCGNGYKASPSSGQAHDVTYRLKLAVANPSAITVVVDPLAQIILGRHVRPFWTTIDGVLNDPPIAAAAGATYIIGAAPTGAWAGFANRLAQWVGVWSLATAPIGFNVVDQSRGDDHPLRWLRRTDAGWVSAEVSPTAAGIIRESTLRSQRSNWFAAGGTATALTIDPSPAFASAADTAGVPFRMPMPLEAVGPTTLKYSAALPALPVLWADGAEIGPGDWQAGEAVSLLGVGYAFVITGLSTRRLFKETRPSRKQSFFASGVFVVPPNVFEIEGEVWGGGSGAWGAWGGAGLGGAGGGGGGYARGIITVYPGLEIPVTVGAGGAGANPGDTPTGGGTSSIGSFLSATGGSINPSSSGSNPVNGNFGGAGVGGDLNIPGSSGDNAAFGYGGTISFGGSGGSSTMGGGSQQTSFAGPGNGGLTPGGGGSGGSSISGVGYAGGGGAPGLVIISW